MKKFNLVKIMVRAWELKKSNTHNYTFATCLKLAWAEAKGAKCYTFPLENERASITSYIVKLGKQLRAGLDDEHAQHKYDILREALLRPCDKSGIAVMDGKMVGLCKYAVRNA